MNIANDSEMLEFWQMLRLFYIYVTFIFLAISCWIEKTFYE